MVNLRRKALSQWARPAASPLAWPAEPQQNLPHKDIAADLIGCLPTTVALVATLTRYIDGALGHRHPQLGLSWLPEKTPTVGR